MFTVGIYIYRQRNSVFGRSLGGCSLWLVVVEPLVVPTWDSRQAKQNRMRLLRWAQKKQAAVHLKGDARVEHLFKSGESFISFKYERESYIFNEVSKIS